MGEMPRPLGELTRTGDPPAGQGPGLRGKLLTLLLAFGVLPLLVAITVGSVVSRSEAMRQALQSLDALTQAQAVHLGTELDRERLLLRTIAGQLPSGGGLERTPPGELARMLVQGLPEDGIFDGLRVVTDSGRVMAAVALRNTAPHWPDRAPAADWTSRRVVVHRDGEAVLAYLVAVPAGPPGVWLEGHVRAEDFVRVFSIPEHLVSGSESAVLEPGHRPVFAAHRHGFRDVPLALPAGWPSGAGPTTTATADELLAAAPVAGTDWRFVSGLPVEVALASLSRLRNTALAGAALLVLLIVLTGALAARSVTTPLRTLAEAAVRFGREGRYRELPAPGRDEVGVVVDSFNRMAADLARSRAELEELHARDLERAQQLATVGELASGVAHEIRNPLTGIRGALELALRSLPPHHASRPLLDEAELQLARIETTTTQLLRYARPPELKEIVTDARLVVERATTIVAPHAAAAGVTVGTDVPTSDATPVRVDPELMVQVLVNLLLNAIEAAPSGSEVTVWLARHAPDAWIGVRDRGPGVPDQLKTEVIRPFFTTKPKGTGLGLSISAQIVSRHRGALRVDDTTGGGATFVVTLPLAEGEGAS
jgi:signal transduction histidine kinase